jgi:acyl-CoA synthetase (AMP-forming)/AMP-acid ligase II
MSRVLVPTAKKSSVPLQVSSSCPCAHAIDTQSEFTGPDDVFTVSFFASDTGQLQGAHLTHANITAGIAAIRAVLPLSKGIGSLDTIASAHSLSTSFGRAVAYTAILEGSSFATLDSTKLFHIEDGALISFYY